ncbi:MAG: hypothetical protein JOZ27_05790 [Caulobacteraceae bacterium]|nr:hypothetical protein [Caulobacteraceae bacterium]
MLAGTQLQELDLSSCDVSGASWAGAALNRTRLDLAQLGGAVGEEGQRNYQGAANAYLALERNFVSLGDAQAGSLMYRRRRRMEKRAALEAAGRAASDRRWGAATAQLARYLGDQVVEWMCDYGESVPRVVAAVLLAYLGFAMLYGAIDGVERLPLSGRGPGVITHDPRDLAVFSLMAMSNNATASAILRPAREVITVLAPLQTLIGIFLTGLLGFVAGNRIRR